MNYKTGRVRNYFAKEERSLVILYSFVSFKKKKLKLTASVHLAPRYITAIALVFIYFFAPQKEPLATSFPIRDIKIKTSKADGLHIYNDILD